jgi:hypothetical protein
MTVAATTAHAQPVFNRTMTRVVLLAGPLLTIWAVQRVLGGAAGADDLGVALLIMVGLLWSPLPLMLPQLLLQDAAAEAGCSPWAGPVRVWRPLLGVGSSVRVEAWMALAGWGAGLAVATLLLR